MKVRGLEARFFGGVTSGQNLSLSSSNRSLRDGSLRSAKSNNRDVENEGKSITKRDQHKPPLQTVVGDGTAFKEDQYLTSANLCRWIIDFSEIQLDNQVGLGSYGVVYRGKWKGVEVAVKRFIKQKLDERSMLEFRAEMALLSELHHPNIVLFIGACIKKPNLCIVTEFVKRGNMKEILQSNSLKLPWMQRLRMLKSAAIGINYLHTLNPVIIHRDLKPSNLLVSSTIWIIPVAATDKETKPKGGRELECEGGRLWIC